MAPTIKSDALTLLAEPALWEPVLAAEPALLESPPPQAVRPRVMAAAMTNARIFFFMQSSSF